MNAAAEENVRDAYRYRNTNTNTQPYAANYFPHIDGLRALAVLGVIIYHLNAKWLPGGFVGVDVFFVISGFVVASSLGSHAGESTINFLMGFYARRLTRIVPALLAMLLVTVLFVVLVIPAGWLTGFTEQTARYAFFGFSNYLLATNAEAYFTPRAEFNAFTHTWSLGVEEQFYLVVPALLFGWFAATQARARKRWAFFALLASIGIASMVYAAWAQTHAPLQAFYSLFSRFWELALGALLFQFTHAMQSGNAAMKFVRSWNSRWLQWCVTLCGAALLVWSYVGLDASAFPWPSAVIPALAAALLIGGVGIDEASTPIRRLLSSSVLVSIGLRSYSLYLWHWPVFVLMRWTFGLASPFGQGAALVITMICAELSYRFVERPIRENRWLRARSSLVRVALFALVIVSCSMLAQAFFAARPKLSLSNVTRQATDWYAVDRMTGMEKTRHCKVELTHRSIGEIAIFEYQPKDCVTSGTSRQMFVLGDSHATAYLMMFDQFAAETGILVRVYSAPGCPYLDLFSPMGSGRADRCIQLPLEAQKDVVTHLHEGDIVFLPSLRLRRFTDQWARLDEAISWQYTNSPEALKQRAAALAEADHWIQPFSRAGARVMFELPKPVFRSPTYRCADWFNASNEVCAGGFTIAREELERYRAPAVGSIQTLAQHDRQLTVWDPLPILCPTGTCSAYAEGRPLFLDGDHVSAFGNRTLFPTFRHHVCGALAEGERESRCR